MKIEEIKQEIESGCDTCRLTYGSFKLTFDSGKVLRLCRNGLEGLKDRIEKIL